MWPSGHPNREAPRSETSTCLQPRRLHKGVTSARRAVILFPQAAMWAAAVDIGEEDPTPEVLMPRLRIDDKYPAPSPRHSPRDAKRDTVHRANTAYLVSHGLC